jgi:protein involved in polysaccharide export with SLBB domain
VLNAVALAGGYTYRANERVVVIRRSGQSKEETLPVDQTVKIYPDDIVTIRQRFF